MTKADKNDNNILFQVSDQLPHDLKDLFQPDSSVSPQMDWAILDRAQQQLQHQARSKRRWLPWVVSVASAAAVVAILLNLDFSPVPAPVDQSAHPISPVLAATDIDYSGRVDILDAFTLARHLETSSQPDTRWDVNNDGLVNNRDVDYVAMAAVRLEKGVL
ncbi:MAG: hypothetical protein JW860_08090 [Sedimentisphaerales bacterium]|nr:hypothetical protein [Sedimentisphaerales bacterium]